MGRIVSFRGLIESGGQDIVPLQTNDGLTGYRIVKFEMMTPNSGTTDYEHTIQIWKTDQSGAVTANVDFSDNRLLAAGYIEGGAATNFIGNPLLTIFDNEIFNQDIYITHVDNKSTLPCNYYIELEQMKLDLSEQTVATLKDIRNIVAQ